ncbi:MAG: Gfo/Idh/MocA family oxidoreductase [Sphingobacteriaceae bacterium]|nr:Gfo/Idh/MocA family oxidoreductase [Sphingobacteriaceae bacterium]
MDEIRWGIIGCGDVTEVKSGPAFNKVNHSRLVAVMRRDGSKAADYARRHQVPKWYDDATQLINDPEVNAIYIATPPLQHEAYTIEALKAGKPVYVEKPMTLDAKAAQRMADAANKLNVKLCVAHYRRAQPMFLKVKELLVAQVIGDIRLVRLKMLQSPNPALIAKTADNWRINPAISGGGLFHDLAPHQLDLMTYYFGDVKNTMGIAATQQENTEADDLVVGNILFQNGVVFTGSWCFSVAPQDQADRCVIYGSKGHISFPMFGNSILVTTDQSTEEYTFEPLPHVQQPMIEKVVDYFLGKGQNPCSGEDALITMKIMDDFTGEKN